MHMFKRFAVTILGAALLVLGAAMMVLPGPGILVIVGGLALLATEYVWARRMLTTAQAQAEKVQEAAVASPVIDRSGSVVGAISVAGPAGGLRTAHVTPLVRAASISLTRRLTAA